MRKQVFIIIAVLAYSLSIVGAVAADDPGTTDNSSSVITDNSTSTSNSGNGTTDPTNGGTGTVTTTTDPQQEMQ